MGEILVRRRARDDDTAAFCCAVYRRSWPLTAATIYSPVELAEHLARVLDISFWRDRLAEADLVLDGELSDPTPRHGFLIAYDEPKHLELGWLFVEPEACGRGLAGALYDEVMRGVERARCWILIGNERSTRFFTRRGWYPVSEDPPEWMVLDPHPYQRFEFTGSVDSPL